MPGNLNGYVGDDVAIFFCAVLARCVRKADRPSEVAQRISGGECMLRTLHKKGFIGVPNRLNAVDHCR